jgi:hypothetical protein
VRAIARRNVRCPTFVPEYEPEDAPVPKKSRKKAGAVEEDGLARKSRKNKVAETVEEDDAPAPKKSRRKAPEIEDGPSFSPHKNIY